MDPHVSAETIERRIFVIRNKRVMLDRDLAELYGVETRTLNQSARRNLERFPDDFMFQLTEQEFGVLKSHFVTSSWGGVRKLPLVFTDYGIAMLSGVLNSQRAVRVNVQIMRAFVRLREIALQSREVWTALQKMEKRLDGHDSQIRIAFDALKSLMGRPLTVKLLSEPPEYPPPGQWPYAKDERKRMGFIPGKKGGAGPTARMTRKDRDVA